MKVNLSIALRIKLIELLESEEGSYARMKMIRVFREELSLTEKEQKEVGYAESKTERGTTISAWAYPDKDPIREYEIGEILTELICTKLDRLEKENKLNKNNTDLYEAFLPEIEKLGANK